MPSLRSPLAALVTLALFSSVPPGSIRADRAQEHVFDEVVHGLAAAAVGQRDPGLAHGHFGLRAPE